MITKLAKQYKKEIVNPFVLDWIKDYDRSNPNRSSMTNVPSRNQTRGRPSSTLSLG